jgi:hypothetical protein
MSALSARLNQSEVAAVRGIMAQHQPYNFLHLADVLATGLNLSPIVVQTGTTTRIDLPDYAVRVIYATAKQVGGDEIKVLGQSFRSARQVFDKAIAALGEDLSTVEPGRLMTLTAAGMLVILIGRGLYGQQHFDEIMA